MKIKVRELSGAALDWAVAKAVNAEDVKIRRQGKITAEYNGDLYISCWEPSTDWGQAGPMIELNAVQLEPAFGYWLAKTDCKTGVDHFSECQGPTPLVAACRAIVSSSLGFEVEIPQELCS